MCIKTDTEIQDQAVSSIGGAVAGAAMFGALGAIIGGRAKTKKVKTVIQYLIITYTDNKGELAYIGFDIKNNPPSAAKLVKEFWELNTTQSVQIFNFENKNIPRQCCNTNGGNDHKSG